MDDLSKLSTSLEGGGSAPADPAAGLSGAIEQGGGLDGLVGKLREGGLGSEVDSWISTGANQPVEPHELGRALGPDTVQQLSAGSGIDAKSLLPLLAMFLPQIIDMLTKNGSTPAGGLDSAAGAGGTPDLGGLLGGLLGGVLGGTGAGTGTSTGTGSAAPSGTADASNLDDLLKGLGDSTKR